MTAAQKTKMDVARDVIARHPRHSQRTIAHVAYRENPELWPSWEACYMSVRRACGGAKSHENLRHDLPSYAKHESSVGTTAPAIPQSKAEPWVAYDLHGSRMLVLSDLHIPYHDDTALALAIEWGKHRKPDVILLNGDAADFYATSRFETDPAKRDFAGELKAVREFLGYLRHSFRKTRIVYKLGNHEERWWHYIWRKAPELLGCDFMDFAAMTHCDKLGIEVVGNARIIRVGALSVLHGHEWRAGISTPVNPARGAFLKANECALQGHLHRTSEHTETSISGRVITCWSTGCLCDLHPEYARVNRWNHGFAEIEMHKGDFSVENKRILHGKVF